MESSTLQKTQPAIRAHAPYRLMGNSKITLAAFVNNTRSWWSTGFLTDPSHQIFYRPLSRAEKVQAVRNYVAYQLRRGCVGSVRCSAVMRAVHQMQATLSAGAPARAAFRHEWQAVRLVSSL